MGDVLETLRLVAKGADILGLDAKDVKGDATLMDLCISVALESEGKK
jgi:hypothetical protein